MNKYEQMVYKFVITDYKTEQSYRNSKKKLEQRLENEKQKKLEKLEQLKKEITEIELAQCDLSHRF